MTSTFLCLSRVKSNNSNKQNQKSHEVPTGEPNGTQTQQNEDVVVWCFMQDSSSLRQELYQAIKTPFGTEKSEPSVCGCSCSSSICNCIKQELELEPEEPKSNIKKSKPKPIAATFYVIKSDELPDLPSSCPTVLGVAPPKTVVQVACAVSSAISTPFEESERRRMISMLKQPNQYGYLLPQTKQDRGRITIVLDLDETIAFARNGPVFPRPGLTELFDLLNEKFETVVWTAGSRNYARSILTSLDHKGAIRHLIYRHDSWFGKRGQGKDLNLLGRDLRYTLMLDNTPECLSLNPGNSVLVDDYSFDNPYDVQLYKICELLNNLASSGQTVPEYLYSSNLVRPVVFRPVYSWNPIYLYRLNIR